MALFGTENKEQPAVLYKMKPARYDVIISNHNSILKNVGRLPSEWYYESQLTRGV